MWIYNAMEIAGPVAMAIGMFTDGPIFVVWGGFVAVCGLLGQIKEKGAK